MKKDVFEVFAAVTFGLVLYAALYAAAVGPRKIVLYADEPSCASKKQVYLVTSRSHLLRAMPHPAESAWMCVE